MRCLTLLLALLLAPPGLAADKRTPREALRPFNDLIGSWRAIGQPEAKLEEKRKGLWEETIRWEWQFKGDDAWLEVAFDKGKYFVKGALRYLPDQDQFRLTLTTTGQETVTFTGPLKGHRLILERRDETTKATHRMVLSILQDNRYLYHFEVQPAERTLSRKLYVVGATKEGKPLVATSGEVGPLCVVSYGPPLSPVTYQGKTYYVCCGGCRAEFKVDPERYIKEYEEVLAKMRQEQAAEGKKP